MALNNVFRELPIINSDKPQHLATMVRWWTENFQRIALNSGTTADTALNGTTGHIHNGVDGQGPPVSAVSNTCVTAGGSTVWHAGNDGAASGLDADLLDGAQGSAFVRTTVAATLSVQHTINVTSGGAPLSISTNNTSTVTNLSADLLDGSDSILFVQSSASTSVRHATSEQDIGSIAASSMATFTVAISGSVGSTVVLGPPSNIDAGLVWCGYMNAADVAEVRVYNSTGAAINPASGTWAITLIRRV